MTSFEQFTPMDVASMFAFLAVFLTKDWNFEFMRERLTQIYDRDFVDKIFPFQ